MKINSLISPLGRQSRRVAVLAAAAAGLGASLAVAGSAQAAVTSGCAAQSSVQAFAPWGDNNQYDLVPGGDFESGVAGWTLSGGATTVAGSEPFDATGVAGSNSLYLPDGASAQSPYFCVDASDPTFRFFAENHGLLANVAVSVVYRGPLGIPVTLPVGVVTLTGSWEPSPIMLTGSILPATLSADGSAQVALRFTAIGGPSQIDDVYVDPRCK
jgi:hypothetical protein